MIATTQHQERLMDLMDLQRVQAIVRQILPVSFDIESIAVDILLLSWSNGVEQPTRGYIRQRCLDQIRSKKKEHRMLEHRQREFSATSGWDDVSHTEDEEEVNELVKILTLREQQVICYRFFMDMSVTEIAEKLSSNQTDVRETISNALFKMRQEAR